MNMVWRQQRYVRGEIVGRVDMGKLFGPLEVPIAPLHWYALRVFPNRELKVLREFRRRNISAWLPMLTTPQQLTRYHRGRVHIERRNVTGPMITGAVLLPDFEMRLERWKEVEGTVGVLRIGEFEVRLRPRDVLDLRRIEAIGNVPKSKRDRYFKLGQLVRVVDGPFRGFCGRVERFDSPGRLSVGVEIFGRITPAEFGEGDIEADTAEGA